MTDAIERWAPRGSDREFSIFYDGANTYGYREFDNAGRTIGGGYSLTLEAVGLALDTFRADFPSARRVE